MIFQFGPEDPSRVRLNVGAFIEIIEMKRKRLAEDDEYLKSPPKRTRLGFKKDLLHLSDELLLRIFSYLSTQELTIIERVSSKLRQLAIDNEVWKVKYYDKWVEPRARRIPIILPSARKELARPSNTFKWLGQGMLPKSDGVVDWKRQYKIRRNWAAGLAKVYEIDIDNPPSPAVLAKVQSGTIFTADHKAGLRAWSSQHGFGKLQAQRHLDNISPPTSIAVETKNQKINIAIGFQEGSFAIYEYTKEDRFVLCYKHTIYQKSAVDSIGIAWPYIATMSKNRRISLFELKSTAVATPNDFEALTVANLHSESAYSHASLSLRMTASMIVATVAYAFSRLNAGWCLGLQEIRFGSNGCVIDSRLTSTVDTPIEARYRKPSQWDMSTRSASTLPIAIHPQLRNPPTSISYQHPYLLVSLPDNTLMSYAVTSNAEKLEISTGRRLWGHTSEVSGAEVSNRGKAVSISSKSNEIRIWELEDLLTTFSHWGKSTQIKSVQDTTDLTAALIRRGSGLGLALNEMKQATATPRWIGFDDEQVVVLGEREAKQIMSCYDFT